VLQRTGIKTQERLRVAPESYLVKRGSHLPRHRWPAAELWQRLGSAFQRELDTEAFCLCNTFATFDPALKTSITCDNFLEVLRAASCRSRRRRLGSQKLRWMLESYHLLVGLSVLSISKTNMVLYVGPK